MEVRTNVSLTAMNTMGLASTAERYVEITDPRALGNHELFTKAPHLVLGGGSNVILPDVVPGLTVRVNLPGIEERPGELPGTVRYRVGAGVDWNQFVRYTLERGHRGLENLILIPGTVGAAPVQNIGAYGAEVAEFITAVGIYIWGEGYANLPPDQCNFGYRNSMFKAAGNRFLITHVEFELGGDRPLRLDYGAIGDELDRMEITQPGAKDVANAVTNIRRRKLPDWFFLGNCGSFFKNPVVARTYYDQLLQHFPELPSYPIDEDYVKIPAGWLIDKAGFKGAHAGAMGVHRRQALVLVNNGGGTTDELHELWRKVRQKVLKTYGVSLEPEVRMI